MHSSFAHGSTRTDLQGNDLNRQWHEPSALLQPTIYHTKMVLQCLHSLSGGNGPVAYVDLHGHSRSKNIFSYSCCPLLSWKKSDRIRYHKKTLNQHVCLCSTRQRANCKFDHQLAQLRSASAKSLLNTQHLLLPPFATLPILLHLQKSASFNLDSCSYMIQKEREQTGRIVVWRQFDIALSYTFECSASGCDVGPNAGHHLTVNSLQEMGKDLASSFAHLDFIQCSNRHVPVVNFEPKGINTAQSDSLACRSGQSDTLK